MSSKIARSLCASLAAGLVAWGCASTDYERPRSTGSASAKAEWALNATAIEACSCTMFCRCYFNTSPDSHGPGCHSGGEEGTYCRFNMGYRVNAGHFGKTRLDGLEFWIAGDLGGDWSKGEMDWAVLAFEPTATREQREAVQKILPKVFPAKWASFSTIPDGKIDWEATKDRAVARLEGGKRGEIVLRRNPGMTNEPIVISNLRYWGAPRNDGFVLMQNEVQAYREGPKAFEFRGTNGFMITIDIDSNDGGAAGTY